MRSLAYRDFLQRSSEARLLIRKAAAAMSPREASALSKGAVVLAAASLERYVNEVLGEKCRTISASSWPELTDGQRQYLAYQIASRARAVSERLTRRETDKRDLSESSISRLEASLKECLAAFDNPSTWSRHRDYGPFMEGAAEPARIDGTIRMFLPTGTGLFDFAASRGRDRAALATALTALIDARHRVAHALQGQDPGPGDVRVWLVLAFILVREIEEVVGTL